MDGPQKTYDHFKIICPYCGHSDENEKFFIYWESSRCSISVEWLCPCCKNASNVDRVTITTYVATPVKR